MSLYVISCNCKNIVTRWIFISTCSMSHPSSSSMPLCLAIWQILLLPLLLYYKLNNNLCPKNKIHHVVVSIIFAVIVWYSTTYNSNKTGVSFKISITTVVTTFFIVSFWKFSVVSRFLLETETVCNEWLRDVLLHFHCF